MKTELSRFIMSHPTVCKAGMITSTTLINSQTAVDKDSLRGDCRVSVN